MANPNIKTIRGANHPLGTGDFTTIQAWEDWADDRTNPYQWAECYQGSDLGIFTISGWASTPTSSGYPRIYAASGELHVGDLNRGPIIASTNASGVNTIGVNYTQIDGLGSTRGFAMNLDTASNILIENCWSTAEDDVGFKALASLSTTSSSGNVIRNCLAIGTNGHDTGFELGGKNMVGGKPGVKCFNCTAYAHKNTGFKVFNSKTPGWYGGADVSMQNCLSMDSNGSDFSYADTAGNGSLTFTNNMSSDGSANDYGTSHFINQSSSLVFVNPNKSIAVTSTGIAGSGVTVLASGDFRLNSSSAAVNAGTSIPSFSQDIRGVSRPYGTAFDIGAYEYELFSTTFPLMIQGPIPVNTSFNLMLCAAYESNSSIPIVTKGTNKVNSIASLYTTSAIPHSSGIPLNTGNFTFKRRGLLFVRGSIVTEATIGGLGTLSLTEITSTNSATLHVATGMTPGSGNLPLNTRGYSGITAPNSWLWNRDINIDSDKHYPSQRTAFLFAESEKNCVDGSNYNFENNTSDNSSAYSFDLIPSGHLLGKVLAHGPIVESGFYQHSSIFGSSSVAGTGVVRFTGGQFSNLQNYSGTSSLYGGTVLTQSGVASIHDQHRIDSNLRRGVATSFWINKKKGRVVSFALTPPQGIVGNLRLGFTASTPMSGEWGVYYNPTEMQASGTTPFNSFKDYDMPLPGGIVPWANTTGGIASTPDTMIPLNEDRWYYMLFWWDTQNKTSYCRVAAPPKGTPGASGYKSEIKPITDKGQKWSGYDILTTREKLKVGGGMFNASDVAPYYNLGYGAASGTSEQFLLDELSVSNRVCSVTAMEQEFDKKYKSYTKQFLGDGKASLFILGEQLEIFDQET